MRGDKCMWEKEAVPGQPFWWEDAAPSEQSDPLRESVDLLVIGAGYTGLSAARVAADCGARVAVIDAGLPGRGASTLNGGMFGAHPRLPWDRLARRYGSEVADRIFAEASPALAFVRGVIAQENISCDFEETGRIQLAWSQKHFEQQHRLAEVIRARSETVVETVPREGLAAHIASPRYFGGLFFPEHGALHPGKYHAGFLAAVRARGVPVTAHARALDIARVGTTFTVKCLHGGKLNKLRAKHIVMATNGYTPRAFGWFARRVFSMPSYLIATAPLPAEVIARLAPGRRMMVETRARHSYFRLSPDGRRILFGGRAAITQAALPTAAARLRQTQGEIWPELADVALSHAWMGQLGYSFDHMPNVGEVGGVHYAMGYSGSGTVMAPYLGAKAAWRALGDPRGATAYADTHLQGRAYYRGGRPWFLHPADLWYRWGVDPYETRAGRWTQ